MTSLFLSAMQKARQMCRDTQEIYLFVSILLQQIDLYTHIHLWNSPPFEIKKNLYLTEFLYHKHSYGRTYMHTEG